jgi:hypothetical protein
MTATQLTIRGRLGYGTIHGLVTFIGVKLSCPAEPGLDGLYMGRTMAEAVVGLAEINDRREEMGLPVVVV